MIGNHGSHYHREVTAIIDVLGEFGGLAKSFMLFGLLAYSVTAKPMRNLDMAASFSEMKTRICQEEGLLKPSECLDVEYKQKLNCCFYVYWYFYKMLPRFLSSLCCGKENSNKYMADHLIELKN